jgi:hypothetical protein
VNADPTPVPNSVQPSLVGGPAAGRFIPVVARVIELGRGPPGLVRWVREHLDGARASQPVARASAVRRLAGELTRLIFWARASTTFADGARHTVLDFAPAQPVRPPI